VKERGKKSGRKSSIFRLQFIPAFLPPKERIPSLTNEPKKSRMIKEGRYRFHLFPPFLFNEPGKE
jgi:hypothetical protein